MAAKIRAKNKEKMAKLTRMEEQVRKSPAQNRVSLRMGPAGQALIQNYMQKNKKKPDTENEEKPKKSTNIVAEVVDPKGGSKIVVAVIDAESRKGRFGWETFLVNENTNIVLPYLFRSCFENGNSNNNNNNIADQEIKRDKFVSLQMAESWLLKKYLDVLTPEAYSFCFQVLKSRSVTSAECRLLNEINMKHCDQFFSERMFNLTGTVVKLSDLVQFHEYLQVCYSKLYLCDENVSRFGFFAIDKNNVVPWVLNLDDGRKYMPLFCFENPSDDLPITIFRDWNLTYVKLAVKIQQTDFECISDRDECAMISFDTFAANFPSSSAIKEYWPSRIKRKIRRNLLNDINDNNVAMTSIVNNLPSVDNPIESKITGVVIGGGESNETEANIETSPREKCSPATYWHRKRKQSILRKAKELAKIPQSPPKANAEEIDCDDDVVVIEDKDKDSTTVTQINSVVNIKTTISVPPIPLPPSSPPAKKPKNI